MAISGETVLRVQADQRMDGFGLMDYNARYYDPLLGRFISPDTLIPQPGSPLAWDRYSYTNNNPINYADPSGHAAACLDGDKCKHGYVVKPLNPWRQSAENSSIGSDKAAFENDDMETLFLNHVSGPLHSKNAGYRYFGDNRGKYEYDKRPNLDRYHMGVDAGYTSGESVYPIAYGTVVEEGWSYDYGYYIIVEHNVQGVKFYSIYAHLGGNTNSGGSANTGILIDKGNTVDTNTVIGTVGNSKGGGSSMSPHLHFEGRQSTNIDLASTSNNGATAFTGHYFWGYVSPEWNTYFVDLGLVFGYDEDFSSIPDN